jgi:two-component system, response regulator PdtaR
MEFREAIVLVVDDNPLIRMGAVDNVVTAGFGALEASNADEAIRILEARPDIHLVLTDVEMPGSMDGLKLAHYIRGRWPPVKLIVVSGKTILDESHLPAEARFFAKPYDDGTILETIIHMLSELNGERLHP